MLDTVILNLPKSRYRIAIPERFTPSATILNYPGHYLIRCVNNPTKQDKATGFYFPRLTLIKRPTKFAFDIWLKIEFSAPKILFCNNLDELNDEQFDELVSTLRQRLLHMGVEITIEALKQAPVSAFHSSKNIPLIGGYTPPYVIKELNKVNLTKKLDLNKSDFRNDGQSMQYYANSNSFVMYDKLRDMKKPKGRAIDKDRTAIQLDLLAKVKNHDPKTEILRLEARLSRKVKMNSTLATLGYEENPTFVDIFKSELHQKIVTSYWEPIISKNAFLFDMSTGPQKMLREIFKNNPKLKPKQAMYLIGLAMLSRDKDGIRTMRAIVEERGDPRTWSRIASGFLILNSLNKYAKPAEWLDQINRSLKEFNPYRTNTYEKADNISTGGARAYYEEL